MTKENLREALERIVDWANGIPGNFSEDLALLRAHLDSLPESEPGEAETALDIISSEHWPLREAGDPSYPMSDMSAAYTVVRAALRAAAGPDAGKVRTDFAAKVKAWYEDRWRRMGATLPSQFNPAIDALLREEETP